MARDIKKAVEEYNRKYSEQDAFFVTDILGIKEMSKTGSMDEMLFDAIINALKAGYILGYRRAQRDAKRKAKEG